MADNQNQVINKFDFYSGSQANIWFGNILIDDINSIQWVRSQGKMPIYGYASQLFDAVAVGTVVVQGTFSINFRQRGYLPAIINEISGLYKILAPDDPSGKKQFDQTKWPVIRGLVQMHLKNGTFGPQSIIEIQELGNNENFFELAKDYENLIWGIGPANDYTSEKDIQQVSENTSSWDPPDVKQAKDIPGGFNILITYGSQSQEAETLSDHMQSTTKSLTGVHLIGESQLVQVGGQPIQEHYSFIARNTDEFIGTSR